MYSCVVCQSVIILHSRSYQYFRMENRNLTISYICAHEHVSVCLSIYLSVCPSVCLSVYVCPSVCLSVCLYICMYVFVWICMNYMTIL